MKLLLLVLCAHTFSVSSMKGSRSYLESLHKATLSTHSQPEVGCNVYSCSWNEVFAPRGTVLFLSVWFVLCHVEQVSPISRSKFVLIPTFPIYTQIAITDILIALLLKNANNLMNRKTIFAFCTLQVYFVGVVEHKTNPDTTKRMLQSTFYL